MMRIRGLLALITVLAILPVATAEAAPPGPFEQVVTTSFPAAYGELLNIYGDALGKGAPQALKEISDKLNFYNQAIGRVSGALDIGGKLYLGETQEAAISAGLLILGELAGSEAGKAYLGAMGLTTLPVTTLITAYQVYQISAAELRRSTVALHLESLYFLIENDPRLKSRNRELGVGDPIPVTPEALEYLWRKVLLEDRWRELFKTYVTEELGKDWPEAGIWNRWALPGNVIEEAEMFQRRDEFKSAIAGLLGFLNRAAKLREQQYIMRKYADELKQKASGLSSSALLEKYLGAAGMLPEVRQFVQNCPSRIRQGVDGDDLSPLIQVVNNSKRYAVDVLAWLPTTGKLGAEREALLKELRNYHDQAWAAREFLQEKRRREELRRAEAAKVTVWRASSFGFSLTFADLQGTVEEEFLKTAAITGVQARIAERARAMNKHYDEQAAAARDDYEQAQQMRPIPPERNQEALEQFGRQLAAYHSIDQQLLSELQEEVGAYIETLKAQARLADERLEDLAAEIDRRLQPFQSTGVAAGRRIGGISELEDTLAGYCGDFPAAGYVGLGRLQFPQVTPKSGDDVGNFTGRHHAYLESLGRHIAEEAKYISFCGGTAYLPSLIGGIDQMIVLVDRLAEKKSGIVALEEKVDELATMLEESHRSSDQRRLEYRVKALAERQRPFVQRLRELLNKGERLKESARAAQQLYQPDLANMENDQAWLSQLRLTLGQLSPVLKDFVARYNRGERNEQYMFKGSVIVLPELAGASGQAGCESLTGRRALMSAADIRETLRQLDGTLAERRLLWLDDQYRLGIREFAALYVADRTPLKRASTPDHYTFVEWGGTCRLLTRDYFDALKASVEAADKIDANFPRLLQEKLGSGPLKNPPPAGMLAIPLRSYPVNNLYIDLDNYPADGLSYLRKVAENCWENETRASVLAAAGAFEEKLAAYRAWQERGDQGKTPERESETARPESHPPQPPAEPPAIERVITEFYATFREAYERKNDARLMSLLSDDWSAGDGTTLFDVEDHFRNMFRVFDEIRIAISDLRSQPVGAGRYRVSYDLAITGRIFASGLKHEERSSVVEEVMVEPNGRTRIVRTPQGRFWAVQ